MFVQDDIFLPQAITTPIQGVRNLPAVYRLRCASFTCLPVSLALIRLFAAIVVQRLVYGNAPPAATLLDDDDVEQALALAE